MNFQNDNLEVWVQHSPHLQFNNNAVQMMNTEYHRVWTETLRGNNFGAGNKNDLDQKRNRKNTLKPKRLQEHICITSFLSLKKISTETPGQRYNQDSIYESLALITTELELDIEY